MVFQLDLISATVSPQIFTAVVEVASPPLPPRPSMAAATALPPMLCSPFSTHQTVLPLLSTNRLKPLSCRNRGFEDSDDHYYCRKSLKYWDKFYKRHQNKVFLDLPLHFCAIILDLAFAFWISFVGCSFLRTGIIWRKIGANIFLTVMMLFLQMGKCF